MQTRSKSDANGTRRLRTRSQHVKNNLRGDVDAPTPAKSSVSPSPPPPARRSRSGSHKSTRSRRDSHGSEGGGKPNNTCRVHGKKLSMHRSPSTNPSVVDQSANIPTTGSPISAAESSPRRQPIRRAVLEKQPKPSTIFRHHLFLEPTLARQAKKRRQKERQHMSGGKRTDHGVDPSTGQLHHDDSDNEDDPAPLQRICLNDDESESGQTHHNAETFFGLRKRTWERAGLKHKDDDSPLPCAAKVPRRKMSAVAPGPDRTFQGVATFRRSRDEELPEGAKDLIAQADMARQKKKKPKNWPNRHSSHSSESSEARGDHGTVQLSPATKPSSTYRTKSKSKKKSPHDGSSVKAYNRSVDDHPSQKSSDPAGDAILRRRQHALDFLVTADDIPSLYAGIVVINDLYNGDDFPPSVAGAVIQAQAMGIILLTESLTALFAKQTLEDDLDITSFGARFLVKRLIDQLTVILMGDMSLHPEKMMGSGLTTSEVRQVSPILQGVLDEIRQVFLALSEEVLTMGGEY